MSFLLQAAGDHRVGVSSARLAVLVVSVLAPLMAQAQSAPALPPLSAEVTVAADAPYGRLAALARLADVMIVLDTSRAPLRRGRVDLLRHTPGVFGARFRAAPTLAQVKLVRLLRPSLLVFEVAVGEPLEPLVALAQSVGGAAYRFELAAAPGADDRAVLRQLRPLTLRFPLTAATPKAALSALGSFPGRVELVLDEASVAKSP